MKNGPPSALEHIEEVRSSSKNKSMALFLDYDGTLTKIVMDPERAIMPDSLRGRLSILSERLPVGVISGRDLHDVRRLVGIPRIFYAGSHGFDVVGPEGTSIRFEKGLEYLPILDMAEQRVREKTGTIPGALVERKRFSVAIHYRKAGREGRADVMAEVQEVARLCPQLRTCSGKKVLELQPDIDWNKGMALLWLLENGLPSGMDWLPIYIGDDMTDEDGFRALKDRGIGIVVMGRVRPTAARYRLKDPLEVERFLDLLISMK